MKCWICSRSTRGYGHADGRFAPGESRRYPIDWVFCSKRCQDIFHGLYGNWLRVQDGSVNPKEVMMENVTEMERAAMRECLKPFGQAASAIGFDRPLGSYSEAEALQVIEAIVGGWAAAMAAHHAASKYPPVRGIAPAADPLDDNPFAGMTDDLPWTEGQ
ncbi:DUF6511 domain-containing protein [Castellaniella hirudinis]|uniref:DUF6511 domain-containing protein n=1 Tax=Castellaniella hirudinis TaxID=1144617 RepID=UPI0039C0D20E